MTGRDRFDVLLADALADLAAPHYPDYFDDVLDVALRRAQRPAWTYPERWLPVSTLARGSTLVPAFPWRSIALVIAILALLVGAFAVAVGLGPVQQPAPPFGPAANGVVAYAIDGDLYVRDTPTGSPRLLVGGPELDVYPVFSRQGTQLAFVRLGGDGSPDETLMVGKPDGSGARGVASGDQIKSFDWSPDGSLVAVVLADGGRSSLLIADSEGDGAAREVALPVGPVDEVYWRPPDGRELVLLAGLPGERAIYAVGPNGSGFRQISALGNDSSYMGPFALSPDGASLAFTEGGDQVRIRILDLASGEASYWGGSLPDLSDTDAPEHLGFPVFSPDGTRFAFGRYWDQVGGLLNHQVFAATVAGGGADAVPISELHRSQAAHNPFAYSFAPDGASVIIQFNDVEQTWLADPAGGGLERLTWGAVMDPPNWQRVAP